MARNALLVGDFNYWRPKISPISKENADRLLAAYDTKRELSPSMTYLGTFKSIRKGVYNTEVLLKRGKEYALVSIPTDSKGYIPQGVMVQRLMDIADGDRNGQTRNMFVDMAITADNISTPNHLEKTYTWYLYPNEGDIKNIDDANASLVTVIPSSAGHKQRRTLMIMGGTKEQRNNVIKAIDDAFTIREKTILAGALFKIAPIRNAAGTYASARWAGTGVGVNIVTIDPKYTDPDHASTAVHEAVHAIREMDLKRLSALKRQGSTQRGQDSDFEESLTTAETVAREKPLTEQIMAERGGGYYPHLKGELKADGIKNTVISDRKTINQPSNPEEWPTANNKGVKAQKALDANYPKTNISKLKIRGSAEAIDTFFRLKNTQGQTVKVQAYAPNAHTTPAVAEGDLMTTEYRDGKAFVIDTNKPKISPLRHKLTIPIPKRRKMPKSLLRSSEINLGGGIYHNRRTGKRHIRLT